MNKWKKSTMAFVVPVLLAVGCATPAHVEKDDTADFTRYKTFSWISSSDNKPAIREVQVTAKATGNKRSANKKDQSGKSRNQSANGQQSVDSNVVDDKQVAAGNQAANSKQLHKETSAEKDRHERETAQREEQLKLNDLTEKQIRVAITAELEKQGWKEDKNKPDVMISYDMLLESSMRRSSSPVYSNPYSRIFYNPWMRSYGTIYYPSNFWGYDNSPVSVKERTLTITMMDARSDQTIWQGWTTSDANGQHVTRKEVQSSVKSIFRKFDVAAK